MFLTEEYAYIGDMATEMTHCNKLPDIIKYYILALILFESNDLGSSKINKK